MDCQDGGCSHDFRDSADCANCLPVLEARMACGLRPFNYTTFFGFDITAVLSSRELQVLAKPWFLSALG